MRRAEGVQEGIQHWAALLVVLKLRDLAQTSKSWEQGRAMAQAVSRRPPTAEARVRSRVGPCGICSGQSGTGTGFPLSISFHRCSITRKRTKNNHHLHLLHRAAQ
jgi:hypothetical protein